MEVREGILDRMHLLDIGSVVLRPRHRLENLNEMNPASSEESYDGHVAVQPTSVPTCRPRHQDRHHRHHLYSLEDHLQPVLQLARVDGSWEGRGRPQYSWLPGYLRGNRAHPRAQSSMRL